MPAGAGGSVDNPGCFRAATPLRFLYQLDHD